jgi:hypothetical protein
VYNEFERERKRGDHIEEKFFAKQKKNI